MSLHFIMYHQYLDLDFINTELLGGRQETGKAREEVQPATNQTVDVAVLLSAFELFHYQGVLLHFLMAWKITSPCN